MSLGIALAGGGLKGVAHIGALKALEELGVKIDYISGSSSGSLFASMYAMGLSIEEMKSLVLKNYKILTEITKTSFIKAGFTFVLKGKAEINGLMNSEKISTLMETICEKSEIRNIKNTKIPLAICTVDTISMKECVFLSKRIKNKYKNIDYLFEAPIPTCVRASMAFPGIYTTVDYNNYNFIDGGTKNNLPIRPLKDMGATKTIGLCFAYDPYIPEQDMMKIVLRAVDIFSMKDVEEAKKLSDLSYDIDAKGSSLLEIENIDKIIDAGYKTIMKNKKEILKLMEE